MPVEPLLEIARRACCRYARRIDDIGDLPYETVRPILLKIENADQLYAIEQRCPQIIGEDAEVWLQLIKRDIPNWDTKPYQPSNPKNWYKVYRKLKKDVQNEKAAREAGLKAALNSINTRKEENTAQVVTGRTLPMPKTSRRRQTNEYLGGRGGSQSTHKMSFFDKVRKEARDARSAKMSRPTHELVQRSTGVKKAPAGFVEDLRREKQQIRSTASPAKSSRDVPIMKPRMPDLNGQEYNMTEDREARLRALKTGKKPGASTLGNGNPGQSDGVRGGLSTQFLEDEDLESDSDSDTDLLGEIRKTKPPVTAPSSQPRVVKRKVAPQLFVTAQAPKKRSRE